MQLSLKYVKASLAYLAAGGTLLLLVFSHLLSFDLMAFYFMQLYGFVAMMIFGLSYLFVPSFAHAFLHSIRLARLQFWLMNVGVVGMTTTFSGLIPYNPNIKFAYVGFLLILSMRPILTRLQPMDNYAWLERIPRREISARRKSYNYKGLAS